MRKKERLKMEMQGNKFFFLDIGCVSNVFNNFLKEKKGWDTYAACPVCV